MKLLFGCLLRPRSLRGPTYSVLELTSSGFHAGIFLIEKVAKWHPICYNLYNKMRARPAEARRGKREN